MSRGVGMNEMQEPAELTALAQALWAAACPQHPWPAGWVVRWGDPAQDPRLTTASGAADFAARCIILRSDDVFPLDTLLHEFVHLLGFGEHDGRFNRREDAMRKRLGLPRTLDRYLRPRKRRWNVNEALERLSRGLRSGA